MGGGSSDLALPPPRLGRQWVLPSQSTAIPNCTLRCLFPFDSLWEGDVRSSCAPPQFLDPLGLGTGNAGGDLGMGMGATLTAPIIQGASLRPSRYNLVTCSCRAGYSSLPLMLVYLWQDSTKLSTFLQHAISGSSTNGTIHTNKVALIEQRPWCHPLSDQSFFIHSWLTYFLSCKQKYSAKHIPNLWIEEL